MLARRRPWQREGWPPAPHSSCSGASAGSLPPICGLEWMCYNREVTFLLRVISLGGKTSIFNSSHFSGKCPLPLMGAGDHDGKGGFVLLTSADSLIKPSSRQGRQGQAFFNRAPAEYHILASPATRALLISYPGPSSRDINKGKQMPWAALNHPPPPLPGPAQTQKLDRVRTHTGFNTKKKPRDTGLPEVALGEEGKAISKRGDRKAAEEPPSPTWGDRGMGGCHSRCSTPQQVKTGLCYCKGISQVQTCLTPVSIHETTSPHPQVRKLTPNPGNPQPGYIPAAGDPGQGHAPPPTPAS